MRKGKHENIRSRVSVKAVALTLSLVVLMCSMVGGTLAWLIAKTDSVVNTFTYGDINITLEETDTNRDSDDNSKTNSYEMIPGNTIEKDPKVTVGANSEDAWLFVKLDKSANFDTFMSYEMADGWTELDSVNYPGVYYREVSKATADDTFQIIKDDKVTVKGEVTKEQLNALNADGASNYPTLTVTAYAVQRDGDISEIDTALKAWALALAQQNA